MEKFSQWRDKGTGISPFMPAPETGLKALLVPKCVLFLLKLPVFLLTIGLFWVLRMPAIGAFMVTVLFGFKRIDFSVDGIKKSNRSAIELQRPKLNEFIIVNYISPIDGIILASLSQVGWGSIVILIPNGEGELFEYSVWSVLSHALCPKIGTHTSTKKVSDYSRYKDKLVFLLAEGSPSNNKAVLPFVESLKVPARVGFKFKTLVVKIQPETLTTPIPCLGWSKYLFKLLTNFNKKAYVKAVAFNHDENDGGEYFDLNRSRRCFEIGQLNIVGKDLSIDKKISFFNYFRDYKLKNN